MPQREQAMLAPGLSIRFVPATNAVSLSRLRRLWLARWIAVSEEEHAVSNTTAGPRAPRKYESRPAAKFAEFPVRTYASSSSCAIPDERFSM